MKTSLILLYCLIPVLLCGQCAPRINPETGLLDCTGGQAGPQGPPGAAGGLQDPGGTGIVKRTTLNTTVVAVGADIPNLATSQITSGTFVDARIASTNVTQHQALLAIAATQLTSGVLADARVAASNVTQHQAALSIAATQLTGTLLPARMPAYSGDATSSAGGTVLTFATVNAGPGSCGDATHVCAITTNPKGLVISQSPVLITGAGPGGGENPLSFTAPLSRVGDTISIPVATSSVNGYLASGDWITFNAKESPLTFSAPLSRIGNSVSVLTGTTAGTLALGNHVHAAADITSGSFADARIVVSNVTQHQTALTIGATQLSGVLPDARVQASNVTQHQAALSIAGTQLTGTVPAARMPAFTGDATSSAGTAALTLASVNGAPGGCGDSSHVCTVTTNAKGLVTGQSAVLITGGVGGVGTGPTLPATCTVGQLFEETTFYELAFCNPDGNWERLVKLISGAGNPNTITPFACDSIEEVGRFAKDTTAGTGATSLYACVSNGIGAFSWQAVATGGSSSVGGAAAGFKASFVGVTGDQTVLRTAHGIDNVASVACYETGTGAVATGWRFGVATDDVVVRFAGTTFTGYCWVLGTSATPSVAPAMSNATLVAPTTADSGTVQWGIENATTIRRVWCSTDTGTATINLDKRAIATPNTAGTSVLSAGLVCDNNSQSSCGTGCDVNTIASGSVTALTPLALTLSAVSGAGVVRVHVAY